MEAPRRATRLVAVGEPNVLSVAEVGQRGWKVVRVLGNEPAVITLREQNRLFAADDVEPLRRGEVAADRNVLQSPGGLFGRCSHLLLERFDGAFARAGVNIRDLRRAEQKRGLVAWEQSALRASCAPVSTQIQPS